MDFITFKRIAKEGFTYKQAVAKRLIISYNETDGGKASWINVEGSPAIKVTETFEHITKKMNS